MKIAKVSFIFVLLLMFAVSAAAQEEGEKLEMEQYNEQLAEWQQRETEAKEQIEQLNTDIDNLNQQITDTDSEIEQTWQDIYDMLGTNEAGVNMFREKLEDIDKKIDGLDALTPEELFRKRDEVEQVEKELAAAKESKIALLTEMENMIEKLDGKLAALKSRIPANIFDQYTVVKGDYLWKIAKKPDIYDNPLQWIRIYNVNKDQIDDPDLIYADQIFNIARGVAKNEHLVKKGEFLYKIAGMAEVFDDPTKWTEIYEANKDVIENPSVIYPYQVLVIPNK